MTVIQRRVGALCNFLERCLNRNRKCIGCVRNGRNYRQMREKHRSRVLYYIYDGYEELKLPTTHIPHNPEKIINPQ